MSTKTKNKVAEQPTKKIIPEINITQQQEQEQQGQQQQNGQQNEETLGAWKRPESYKKWVAQPFEQRPEKKQWNATTSCCYNYCSI